MIRESKALVITGDGHLSNDSGTSDLAVALFGPRLRLASEHAASREG